MNPLNPFSTFRGERNAADFMFMERQQAIDGVVRYFISLYKDDVDINDAEVQTKVFKHSSLDDLTDAEMRDIRRRVEQALN